MFQHKVLMSTIDKIIKPSCKITVKMMGSNLMADIRPFLSESAVIVTNSYSILFCTRELNKSELKAQAVTDVDKKNKKQTLQDFNEGRLNYIVTTIDLKNEITRKDVRNLIFYAFPESSLENILDVAKLFGQDNASYNLAIFYASSNDIPAFNSDECRRRQIMTFLNHDVPDLIIKESCCDSCSKVIHSRVLLHKLYKQIDDKGIVDFSNDARVMLELVRSYKGECEEKEWLNFLLGVFPEKYSINHPLHLFGACSKTRTHKEYWNILCRILLKKNYIRKATIEERELLVVTTRGRGFLKFKTKSIKTYPYSRILRILPKTDTEFYIEKDIIKTRSREIAQTSIVTNSKRKICASFDFESAKPVKQRRKNL